MFGPPGPKGTTVESDLSLILTGGMVYSGENKAPVIADVWIKNDRIVGIGNLGSAAANLVLDVSGLIVTPGFIYIHSLANWQVTR